MKSLMVWAHTTVFMDHLTSAYSTLQLSLGPHPFKTERHVESYGT